MGDLYGNAPDRSSIALILIDVINGLEFPGGDLLARRALPMAQALAGLVQRARRSAIPIVYANDNFGRWRSDFRTLLGHCLERDVPGRPIAELLRPEEVDYFVLKPKHSGFYATALELLLTHLEARTLVLTGIAAENCVLFTAHDAYLRDYGLIVPSDCVASQNPADSERALVQIRQVLKGDVRSSADVDFEALKRVGRGRGGRSS
ncbi:MAG TPA: isochorismatase family cysteine hydrolase [Polyangiaceae bacterium]